MLIENSVWFQLIILIWTVSVYLPEVKEVRNKILQLHRLLCKLNVTKRLFVEKTNRFILLWHQHMDINSSFTFIWYGIPWHEVNLVICYFVCSFPSSLDFYLSTILIRCTCACKNLHTKIWAHNLHQLMRRYTVSFSYVHFIRSHPNDSRKKTLQLHCIVHCEYWVRNHIDINGI